MTSSNTWPRRVTVRYGYQCRPIISAFCTMLILWVALESGIVWAFCHHPLAHKNTKPTPLVCFTYLSFVPPAALRCTVMLFFSSLWFRYLSQARSVRDGVNKPKGVFIHRRTNQVFHGPHTSVFLPHGWFSFGLGVQITLLLHLAILSNTMKCAPYDTEEYLPQTTETFLKASILKCQYLYQNFWGGPFLP